MFKFLTYRESDLPGTIAYGGHAWRSYINVPFFPFGICININIIFIFTSSVCWALHSAETSGQYLPWVTYSAAWSPLTVPEASGGTPVTALLLYSDKPSSVTVESSGGQGWTSKRGQGVAQRGGQGCTSGGEQASETPAIPGAPQSVCKAPQSSR